MNIRPANTDAITPQRRTSEDMLPVPRADEDAIVHLEQLLGRRWMVHIEASLDDRARIEHSHWCHCGDWHVAEHKYFVDDDTRKVYIASRIEGG